MSAKSVDLQTTVPRANEVSRALRLQSGQEYVQAQEVASGQKRQAERAQKSVPQTAKAQGGRVEAKKPPRDGRPGRERKGKPREKGHGNLLDVTCDG